MALSQTPHPLAPESRIEVNGATLYEWNSLFEQQVAKLEQVLVYMEAWLKDPQKKGGTPDLLRVLALHTERSLKPVLRDQAMHDFMSLYREIERDHASAARIVPQIKQLFITYRSALRKRQGNVLEATKEMVQVYRRCFADPGLPGG